MKTIRYLIRHLSRTVLFALLVGITGCATRPPSRSGFLEDYSLLKEDHAGGKNLQWWEKEGFDWHRYQKVIIDTVVVYDHHEAQKKQINPAKTKELTTYFHNTVERELADDYPVVTEPGPDVLRIRTAITEIVPSNPAINYPAMAVVFFPIDMGGASIEAAFMDSETDEVLAIMVDRKMGSPFKPRGFTKMGHARAAFDHWAKELKLALEIDPK